jgi:chromosomal replication initiator protein
MDREGADEMVAEWMAALPRLRRRVGERNFATWIEPIRCSRDERGLCLEVANRFFQEWVIRHFLTPIRESLGEEHGEASAVRVIVSPGVAQPRPVSPLPVAGGAAARRDANAPRGPKIGHLVAAYTFETFVVGDANRVAYEAARSVAALPGRRFNPFFLWGGVGLGKTHLINALAHDLLARPPRRRMACLPAEAFMNTLITSIRQDQMGTFRERFRDVDVLILDDVHVLAGKERTQEEFFHTFNALHAAGKQLVLTSDKPPQEIAELEQRLRSRFGGGLIADIRPPTGDMRLAIVRKKAALHGVELSDEVTRLVAQRSGPTVRELEGALNRVLAAAALGGTDLNAALVQRELPPVVPAPQIVSVETVQAAVSEHFRVSVVDLKSHDRSRALSFPRQVAMYLSRNIAAASFPSIAEKFGGRDHSTVMHACQTLDLKRQADPGIESLLTNLETDVRSRATP